MSIEEEYKAIYSRLKEYMEQLPEQIKKCELDIHESNYQFREEAKKGDDRENAGKQLAKERVARLNIKLKNLYSREAAWETFKGSKSNSSFIQEGCTVKLHSPKLKRDFIVLLAPSALGNSQIGVMSVTTPISKAILGKVAGDSVHVKTTAGVIEYIIEEVY